MANINNEIVFGKDKMSPEQQKKKLKEIAIQSKKKLQSKKCKVGY